MRDPVRSAYSLLDGFWAKANQLVWSGYEGLHLPYDDRPAPALSIVQTLLIDLSGIHDNR
jgi:hypothetical protein